MSSKIGIFTHSKERSDLLANELTDQLSEEGKFREKKLFFLLPLNQLNNENLIDILSIKFEAIQIEDALVSNARTPALLESIVLKHYDLKKGNFLFLEWSNFTEDVLVTSDRSALISSQTSKYDIWTDFVLKFE